MAQTTTPPQDLLTREEIENDAYNAADKLAEKIFRDYVQARPIEAMRWADVRDLIRANLLEARAQGFKDGMLADSKTQQGCPNAD